jgi:hypothetical protein
MSYPECTVFLVSGYLFARLKFLGISMTLPPSEETVISGFEIVSITIVLAHVDVVTSGNLAKFCKNFSSRPNKIIGQEQHN